MSPTFKITASFAIGFALGCAAYFGLYGQSTKSHWKAVRTFIAYYNNPQNYETAPDGTQFEVASDGTRTQISLSVEIEPHLAALVAAGELNHVDLVLPTVPASRESHRYWMRFATQHPQIVYATGNPSYTDIKPAGTQPLHLNIWFREEDNSVVQKLVHELESLVVPKASGKEHPQP